MKTSTSMSSKNFFKMNKNMHASYNRRFLKNVLKKKKKKKKKKKREKVSHPFSYKFAFSLICLVLLTTVPFQNSSAKTGREAS